MGEEPLACQSCLQALKGVKGWILENIFEHHK